MDPKKMMSNNHRKELRALHHKPGVSFRIRYLASIEALIALGEERLLHPLFSLALDEGVTLTEIHEAMLQACIFCGIPRTINGFSMLQKCLRERRQRGIPDKGEMIQDKRTPELTRRMGRDLFRKIYYYNHMEILKALKEDHQELPGWILNGVYGTVLSRPGLDPKTRELAAIAALTVLKVFPQLLSHIKGGLNLGADRNEVKEVILQMEAYVPHDTIRKGLRILNLGTRSYEEVPPTPH